MEDRDKFFLLFCASAVGIGAMFGVILAVAFGPHLAASVVPPICMAVIGVTCVYSLKPDGPLADRIVAEMGFGSSGSESFDRAVSRVVLKFACRLGGRPRSMEDLLERLDYRTLVREVDEEQLRGIKARNVEEVRIRCQALPARVVRDLFGEKSDA